MKKKLRLLILSILAILMMSGVGFASNLTISQQDILAGMLVCKDYPVSVKVDGEPVVADVAPVIVKERTLIPARAVFEKMGGQVGWKNDQRVVDVSLGKSNVQLTIDSSVALVNGQKKSMDVPAVIINDRTFIPVRFVAESLNCQVDWDDPNRTVVIDSPIDKSEDDPAKIPVDNPSDGAGSPAVDNVVRVKEITVEEQEDYYQILIQGNGRLDGVESFALDNPQRFVVDINKTLLDMQGESLKINNNIFAAVRYSQFNGDTVRVVIDLNEKVAGKVSLSDDKETVMLRFEKGKAQELEELGGTTADGLDVLDWRAAGKLIVIDPGHGGKDSGSRAIRNGKTILNEKDINLDIALRLNRMLQAAGANTYLTREDDTYIGLYERPEKANALGGDLYISIHNNSSDSTGASGTEVYYYRKSNEADYGIDTAGFAKLVQKELIQNIGLKNRGAKSEPAYAVLNKTKMPAIIIEGGFLSNDTDLNMMLSDKFKENYAYATAKAILQTLNESVQK